MEGTGNEDATAKKMVDAGTSKTKSWIQLPNQRSADEEYDEIYSPYGKIEIIIVG